MDTVDWAALILGIMKILDIVANLTPTTRDNDALQKLRKFAKILGTPVPDRQRRGLI